ncbi:MAG: hypothetical protein DI629_18435 [Mesorhizobium amorphae]|nr:MAG: hypothetical protein DI629_18435 [Mesorhizobium amorphae]
MISDASGGVSRRMWWPGFSLGLDVAQRQAAALVVQFGLYDEGDFGLAGLERLCPGGGGLVFSRRAGLGGIAG